MTEVIQIVCRTACAGGDIDVTRAWSSVPQLRGKSHLLFLIHGYNNTWTEANESYTAFCNLQKQAVSAGLDWTFGSTVVEVFWPGDAEWGIARPAFYPWAIPKADATADLLSAIIKDLLEFNHGELYIQIVAHSMGNRVALRMASRLSGLQGLIVRRAVHMASAVAVWKLEDNRNELSLGLAKEISTGAAISLYSEKDAVLAYAFPFGETADFVQEGFLPVALGHQKWIKGDSQLNFTQADERPAGHGDYWGGDPDESDALKTRIRDVIHNALDFGVSGTRSINANVTPEMAIPQDRELIGRYIPSRETGAAIDSLICN